MNMRHTSAMMRSVCNTWSLQRHAILEIETERQGVHSGPCAGVIQDGSWAKKSFVWNDGLRQVPSTQLI